MKTPSFRRLLTVSVLVAFGCLSSRDASASGENCPVGVARALSPAEVIRSAGTYSAYTGSMSRTVTDLVVPGAVGGYPLVFARTSTSRYVPGDDGDGGAFGPGGSWRHTYRWGLYLDSPGVWGVHYPDGRVILFTAMAVAPPTAGSPTPPADPYLRCSSPGVPDRLDGASQSPNMILHLEDGGSVYFQSIGTNTWHVASIADPYNQVQAFSYYSNGPYAGKLYRITEPAGRWLQFTYGAYNGGVVVSSVAASNGQSVGYFYTVSGGGFTELAMVNYASDLNPATGQPYQATYTYQPSNNSTLDVRPLLKTCSDPHFSGPMTGITYSFVQGTGAVYGQIQSEIDSTGVAVSTYNQSTNWETRGDGPKSFYGYYSYLVTQKMDYDGNNTLYGYDANRYLNTLVNGNNHTTTMTREPYAGKPTTITVTDPATNTPLTTTISYGGTYVANPYWVTKITGPRNDTTLFTRDPNHRVTLAQYPDGTYESLSYNGFGQPLTHRHTDGTTSTYSYDGAGHLSTSSDNVNQGAGLYVHYYYDSLDRLKQVTDYNGHNTFFLYNGRHQLTQQKHDDGTHADYTYDAFGNCQTVSDELQHVTTINYDNHRRPTSTTTPVSTAAGTYRTATFSYERGTDPTGNANTQRGVSTKTLPSGKQVKRVYTGEGRLRSVSRGYFNGSAEPDTTTDTYYYDGVGHVTQAIDANGILQAAYTYDAMERKSTVTDANGHVTTWSYYPAGSPYAGRKYAKQTPGPGLGSVDTTYWLSYDAAGRPGTIQDASGNLTGRSYTTLGQLYEIADQNGGYYYSYDALGRVKSLLFPDNTTQGWTYDPVGNLSTYTNRAGNVETISYDDRNRRVRASWNDGVTSPTSWGYDAAGHISDLNNNSAFLHYTFEDSGLTLSEQDTNWWAGGAVNTTGYTRDIDGNISNMTYPAGDVPPYSYDHQNRCTGLTNWSQLYFEGELVSGRSLPLVSSQYWYQANDRVREVWQHHGGNDPNATSWPGSNISALNYGYAPDGQETWAARQPDGGASGSALENGTGENYAYYGDGSIHGFGILCANTLQTPNAQGDSNAVAQAGGPGSYGNNYNYDDSGNRSQVTQMGANISYGADGENRYGGSAYDGNGDTTNSAVGWTYGYNAEGQMTSATRLSDGYPFGFGYDGLGRLVYQAGTSGPVIFCYAGQRRIEERTMNGNTSLYRYFFDSPKSDQIVFRQTSNGVPYSGPRLYYQSDAKGNTTHVSNDAGQVVEQYLYDAYGTPYVYNAAGAYLGQVSPQDNRYLFKGASAYEWLSLPAMYYCRNRMYLPIHGRWLQPDPSGFAGGDVNLYRYCGNDPVNSSDPSGLDAEPDLTPDAAETGGGSNDDDNLQISPYTPTGSHIPVDAYNNGPFTMIDNAVSGQTISGPSSSVLNAMRNGTYEGTGTVDGLSGTFARATYPDGSSAPLPPTIIVIPGFGGGYDSNVTSNGYGPSNAILHQAIGDDNVFVADRDNLGAAAQYGEDMNNLGSSVNVVGYSLGGTAAVALTNILGTMGVDVTNLTTLDPVLLFGGSLTEPSNLINQQQNYYQQSGGITGLLPWSVGNFSGTAVGGANNVVMPTNHPNMPGAMFGTWKNGGG